MWLFCAAVYRPVGGSYEILEFVDGGLKLKTTTDAYILNFTDVVIFHFILKIQATLFISKSRGPDKILRVISNLR